MRVLVCLQLSDTTYLYHANVFFVSQFYGDFQNVKVTLNHYVVCTAAPITSSVPKVTAAFSATESKSAATEEKHKGDGDMKAEVNMQSTLVPGQESWQSG